MDGKDPCFRRQAVTSLVGLLAWACVGGPGAAAAAGTDRVRPLDARARALVEAATAASPTVARLVDALDASDVVVYVQVTPDVRFAGDLRFLACSGAWRFLVIRVSLGQSREERFAVLGHELQHACEVGEAPCVRDEKSLAELMARIGYALGWDKRRFETDAAVLAGGKVRREVTRR